MYLLIILSRMMILGGRTKQLNIFCRVSGFTSDFLSFIVMELIQFFHIAIQLCIYLDAVFAIC